MRLTQEKGTVKALGNCIGCRDCKGLCLALAELAFLPEVVLKKS